jgi:hypothetical protein
MLHLRLETPGRNLPKHGHEVDPADRCVEQPWLLALDPVRLDGTDGVVFIKNIVRREEQEWVDE